MSQTSRPHDILAVGNAIVDVLGHTEEAFLGQHGVPKGGMTLIGTDQATEITEALRAEAHVAGGMVGNSCACLASLGGTARFVGKVGDDALGEVYRRSMADVGVVFETESHPSIPTGRCLIAVTPDAERSMATSLGAAGHVTTGDIDDAEVAAAGAVFLEGFLFEGEEARAAFDKAVRAARAADTKVAMTLCDAGLVERQHDALLAFIEGGVDILFANDAEACKLTGRSDVDEAVAAIRDLVPAAAVTRGADGSTVFGPGEAPQTVPATAPDRLVDTTGAGDAYAGGFLFGHARGRSAVDCARLGSLAATEVIGHMGPRPQTSLKTLAAEAGLL